MFFPTGGGLNLLSAKLSHETECIELDVGNAIIIKPQRLLFESFNFDEEWNYFRLETDNLSPTGFYPKVDEREYLTELEPLVYTDANCYEYNDYNGKELPKGARSINRFLNKSSFVIFQNTSKYNKIRSTYDGRHNKMTADRFKAYIGKAVKTIVAEKDVENSKISHHKLVRPTSYRSKKRRLTIAEIKLLKKVINLAKESDKESDDLEKQFGLGSFVNPQQDNFWEFYKSPKPKSEVFKKFIKNLSHSELILVASVMYRGRDGIPPNWGIPLDEQIKYFNRSSTLAISITEKAPLIDYLKKGIRLYR
jgi:hypothetical protein